MKFILFLLIFQTIAFSNEVIRSYEIRKDNPNLSRIADSFEITEKIDHGFLVNVLKDKEHEFLKLAPRASLRKTDINQELKKENILLNYRTYKQAVNDLNLIEKKYPKIVKAIQYGESYGRKPLMVYRLQKNSVVVKPKLLITAATHGDELITVKTIFHLLNNVLNSQSVLEHTDLYFIPMVNPDGFEKRSRYTMNRVDPNRQYPWPDMPNREIKVPAIKHLVELFKTEKFEGSLDIHASGEMIMYPWAYTYNKPVTADDVLFKNLVTKMGAPINYKHGQISKVIYIAKGSSADFYYWKHNTIALAIELGRSKYPRANKVDDVLKKADHFFDVFLQSFVK